MNKIVFGTWPLSGDYKKINQIKSIKLLKLAYIKGVREFDTAPNYGYGKSEKLLGIAFKKSKFKPKINTKVGNNHKKIKNFIVDNIKKTFEQSLKNLQMKKINILFLHNPKNLKNIVKIIDYFNTLKKEGKINDYGLSISKDFKYKKSFLSKFKIFQLDHNLIYLNNLLENFFKNKIIYARSPFAAGTILNLKKKYSKSDVRSKWLSNSRRKIIEKQCNEIKNKYNLNLYDQSIEYLMKEKFTNKVIFGLSSKRHLDNLLKTLKNKKKLNFNINEYQKFYFNSETLRLRGF